MRRVPTWTLTRLCITEKIDTKQPPGDAISNYGGTLGRLLSCVHPLTSNVTVRPESDGEVKLGNRR